MVHEENKEKINVPSWLMWNIKGECNKKEMLLGSSRSRCRLAPVNHLLHHYSCQHRKQGEDTQNDQCPLLIR